MAPDAIDQSWGFIDPVTAKNLGVKLVCDYLSHDPSKNWTAAQIRAYHAQGIGTLLNWESTPGRPLEGAAAGREDAQSWLDLVTQLITQVGYAPNAPIAAVFSCDRQVTSDGDFATVGAYYRATRAVLEPYGYLNGVYGEADVVDYLASRDITDCEWQTLAWSGGRISPNADLYQSDINDVLGGSSVDFDQILHAPEIGAWWPPNSPLNNYTPTPTPVPDRPITKDDEMFDLVQIADTEPTRGRQYAVRPGSVPWWLSPTDKQTMTSFGWFTSLTPKPKLQVEIDRLIAVSAKATGA